MILSESVVILMNYIGTKVVHKAKFGKGEIISQNNNIISVRFEKNGEIKKFCTDTCFNGFLKIFDQKTHALSNEEILRRALGDDYYNSSKSYQDEINTYIMAIKQEIGFHKANKSSKYNLIDGSLIKSEDNSFIYLFDTDSEMNYPAGTLIKVHTSIEVIPATIKSCEEFSIIISTKHYLGKDLSMLSFTPEPWFLLNALLERVQDLRASHSKIVEDLVLNGKSNINDCEIAKGQKRAIDIALVQPITFVWGAPGTGKTETLAKIALKFINAGRRVLMLSYSNVAVDGAVLRVSKKDNGNNKGKIIRYGYPKSTEILNDDYLSSFNLALQLYPELKNRRDELIEIRHNSNPQSFEYINAGEELSKIRLSVLDIQRAMLREASFVATTVSQATIEAAIYEQQFDVVMFDETSMAITPLVFFAASLAKKHFICFGDFCQLPPIVLSSQESLLNKDIYEHCYISQAVQQGKGHHWLCMLNEQFRMDREIADFASEKMYKSMITTPFTRNEERERIKLSYPFIGKSIGFYDLDGMMTVVSKLPDKHSRVNPLSAFIDIGIALNCSKNNSVAIISPFNAQARLLHAMIRDIEEVLGENKPNIYAATVHQFQGSEKDIVIYDVTDSFPRKKISRFLRNTAHNFSNRLFNVALTRAKGKFISVGHHGFVNSMEFPGGNMYAELMKKYRYNSGVKRYAREIISDLQDVEYSDVFSCGFDIERYLLDIANAKKIIRVELPYQLGLPEFSEFRIVSGLITAKEDEGIKVIIRVRNKNQQPDGMWGVTIENENVLNPLTIIDEKIIWYGFPHKYNTFEHNGQSISIAHNPCIRFVGKHTARNLRVFLDMNKVLDNYVPGENEIAGSFINYLSQNCKCSKCGSNMKVKMKNKYYLACSAYPKCKNTSVITHDIAKEYLYAQSNEGIRCPKCNCSLEPIRGQYGLYFKCLGLKEHKYKITEI